MKRLFVFVVLFMLVFSFSATAQNVDQIIGAFEDFADDAAPSIPMLSDVGLRWSDAYIGGFPHFGVGTTVGFVVVPMDDVDGFFTTLGVTDIPKELSDLGGIPIPATSVEARIGGFILPFDIGIKAGYIPEALKENMASGVAVDYSMVGFDLRYRLVKEGLLMPEVSVGGGYTYLEGTVSTSVGTADDIFDGTNTLFINQPDIFFGWRSSVLDAKVQVSKNVLMILRPYAGLGLSYGISEAGGGYEATISTDAPEGFAYWEDTYGFEDVDSSSAAVYSESNAMAFRAFAGTSVNLFMLKLDLSGTYNPVSQAMGAQFNVRAQF
jgi:hypothetical protein